MQKIIPTSKLCMCPKNWSQYRIGDILCLLLTADMGARGMVAGTEWQVFPVSSTPGFLSEKQLSLLQGVGSAALWCCWGLWWSHSPSCPDRNLEVLGATIQATLGLGPRAVKWVSLWAFHLTLKDFCLGWEKLEDNVGVYIKIYLSCLSFSHEKE